MESSERTVVLRLRFADFARATRSHTMPRAAASTDVILGAARALVAAAGPMIAERGLTLVGLAVCNLDREGAQQMELPFNERCDASTPLHRAVDLVRERYGNAAVLPGVLLGRGPDLEMPMLPD